MVETTTEALPQDVPAVDETTSKSETASSTGATTTAEEEESEPTSTASDAASGNENDDDDEPLVSEEEDEEGRFIQNLEDQRHNEEDEKSSSSGTNEAPVLLRAKLKEEAGAEEKKVEHQTSPANAPAPKSKVNQLDHLLNKAAEYSNFIAADLEELQKGMTKQAAQAMLIQEQEEASSSKKRKRSSATKKATKKSKGVNGGAIPNMPSPSAVSSKPIFIQPPNLSPGCVLKDYQLEGVRWMASLFENGVSGILADEMGLGKTIQVISLIAHLSSMNVNGPYIVVAPLATLPNWIREFEKWLPSLPAIRYHGAAKDRDRMLNGPLDVRNRRNPDFPVIVTSYEVAIKDQNKLAKLGEFTYLVVDEGQRLKNHRCTLISSLKRLPASNRLLLSGTPIQNNLDELWSLLNFVNPQIFDDLSVFQSWFKFRDIGQRHKQNYTSEDDIMEEQRKNCTVSKLHEILRPFLLRRIKRDVLTDMPPKKEIVVYAGMSKLQSGYYKLIEQDKLRDVLRAQGIPSAKSISQINRQMNHRKNSNHPFLFGEPIDPGTGVHVGTAHPHLLVRASGKFALLDRLLTRLFRDKHQVLIFSQMTAVLSVIEDYLIFKNWKYCRIDGSTKIDERQRQMDAFNSEKTNGEGGTRNDSDDRIFVFLLSTRAGGLGINLATADTCIIFDSDWNPHQDSQAMDRCHRIGQNRPVAVYRLLTTGSVDIDMMEKQMSKKKLERMAIVGGDFRKAGQRWNKDRNTNFDSNMLSSLLEDDIKDLQGKASEVEDIKINEEELDRILDRKRLFAEGADAIPTEGKMYDVVDNGGGGEMLGAMNG